MVTSGTRAWEKTQRTTLMLPCSESAYTAGQLPAKLRWTSPTARPCWAACCFYAPCPMPQLTCTEWIWCSQLCCMTYNSWYHDCTAWVEYNIISGSFTQLQNHDRGQPTDCDYEERPTTFMISIHIYHRICHSPTSHYASLALLPINIHAVTIRLLHISCSCPQPLHNLLVYNMHNQLKTRQTT